MDKGNQQSTDSSTKVTTTTTTQLTAGRDIGVTGQHAVDLARESLEASNRQAVIWSATASNLFTGVSQAIVSQAQTNTAAVNALAARAPNDAADLANAVSSLGKSQMIGIAGIAAVVLLFSFNRK